MSGPHTYMFKNNIRQQLEQKHNSTVKIAPYVNDVIKVVVDSDNSMYFYNAIDMSLLIERPTLA